MRALAEIESGGAGKYPPESVYKLYLTAGFSEEEAGEAMRKQIAAQNWRQVGLG